MRKTPQAETIDDRPVFMQLGFWIALIAVAGTLGNGYMMYKSSSTNTELDRIKVILQYQGDQIEKARAREERNLKTIIEQGIKILNLTSQVKDKTTQAELLNGFIESLPFAAWIKERGPDGIFRVITLNEEFTVNYGLTKKESIGFSDYDFYPDNKELADSFQDSDRVVYLSGREFRVSGSVMKGDKIVEREYVKFPISLPSGFEGIGGLILE